LIALIITIVNTYQSAILVDEFGLNGNVLFIFLILAEIVITILALKIYKKIGLKASSKYVRLVFKKYLREE